MRPHNMLLAFFVTQMFHWSGTQAQDEYKCTDDKRRIQGMAIDFTSARVVDQRQLRDLQSCEHFCCNTGHGACGGVTWEEGPSWECRLFACENENEGGCKLVPQDNAHTSFNIFEPLMPRETTQSTSPTKEPFPTPGDLNGGQCPPKMPNVPIAAACLDKDRIEHKQRAINPKCATVVNEIRLRDFESCWAYCCYYDTHGCTSVTWYEPPDWRCVMYNCRTEAECPTTSDNIAHTAFVRIATSPIQPTEPTSTTTTPKTVPPWSPPLVIVTTPEPQPELCDLTLSKVNNVEIVPSAATLLVAETKLLSAHECTEVCCTVGKSCTGVTFDPFGNCLIYNCPTQQDCPVRSRTLSVTYMAYARLPAGGGTTTPPLTNGTGQFCDSSLTMVNNVELVPLVAAQILGNLQTASLEECASFCCRVGNDCTGLTFDAAGNCLIFNCPSQSACPVQAKQGAITLIAFNRIGGSTGGTSTIPLNCPVVVPPVDPVLLASLDPRCLINRASPNFPGERIDERCVSALDTLQTTDEIACWAYCCQHVKDCTTVSFNRASRQCATYTCLTPQQCPTVRDSTWDTFQLRTISQSVTIIDAQSSPWLINRPPIPLAQLTREPSSLGISCEIEPQNVVSGRIQPRRATRAVIAQHTTRDLITCMSHCCHQLAECNAVTFTGAPLYTCVLHSCPTIDDCQFTPAIADENVWSSLLRPIDDTISPTIRPPTSQRPPRTDPTYRPPYFNNNRGQRRYYKTHGGIIYTDNTPIHWRYTTALPSWTSWSSGGSIGGGGGYGSGGASGNFVHNRHWPQRQLVTRHNTFARQHNRVLHQNIHNHNSNNNRILSGRPMLRLPNTRSQFASHSNPFNNPFLRSTSTNQRIRPLPRLNNDDRNSGSELIAVRSNTSSVRLNPLIKSVGFK